MERKRKGPDRRHLLKTGAVALGLTASSFRSASFAQAPATGARKLSELLADYIATFDVKSVPPEVIDRARVVFIDTLGVMLAGSREEISQILCGMVAAEGAAAAAGIVGQSLRTSPQLAALANGVASHAMDYDLSYVSGQAMAAVMPAVLPLAETTRASGAETIAAIIIGAEVAGRLARSNFYASSVAGWHTVGTVGAVAAAAAAARLVKPPSAVIPDVIGIGASLASGISVNFGSMSKPLHAGNAARNGVMAALLGARGFTANHAALEGPSGYFAAFGRGLEVSLDPFNDLGKRYDLVSARMDIKAYPCGGLAHTSIEAALELRPRVGGRLADIKNIHCFVTRNAGQRAGTQYPSTVEGAKFSLAYVVAYALVHGAPRIAAFTETSLHDERVRAVARTVTASVDPELGLGTNGSPARLRITFADGSTIEQRRDSATGSMQTPMTQAQLEDKFSDCAAQAVSTDAAKRILSFAQALPDQKSFEALWPLLRMG